LAKTDVSLARVGGNWQKLAKIGSNWRKLADGRRRMAMNFASPLAGLRRASAASLC